MRNTNPNRRVKERKSLSLSKKEVYTTKELDNTEDTCLYSGEAACLGFNDCLTKEEEIILADIRALSEKAMNIKNRLKLMEGRTTGDMSGSQEETQQISPGRQALMDELDDLRKNRKELDRLMEGAHHRKMVLLGHRKP
ncbi:MAG: hypothetical protein AB1401_02370 [Thermodesulfobacteriota bacterium]